MILSSNDLRLYGAESKGDHIRIEAQGQVETKAHYAEPVEVTVEARWQKSMAISVLGHTHGLSLPDSNNWHKIRFVPVENTFELWVDGKRVASSTRNPANTRPGPVRIISLAGVSEIKLLTVKAASAHARQAKSRGRSGG